MLNLDYFKTKGLEQNKAMRIAKLVFLPSVLREELQYEERQEAIRIMSEIACDRIDELKTDENSETADKIKKDLRIDSEFLGIHYASRCYAEEMRKANISNGIHSLVDGSLSGIGLGVLIKYGPKIITKII